MIQGNSHPDMSDYTTPLLAGRLLALRGAAKARQGVDALRNVRQLHGVSYIDHGASTFLDAALFALIDLGKPLVWITDAALVHAIDERMEPFLCDHVDAVVFYGSADPAHTRRVEAALDGAYFTDHLRTAVFTARELAVDGGRVLFSPGCPSANGMANHAERSAEFRRACNDL